MFMPLTRRSHWTSPWRTPPDRHQCVVSLIWCTKSQHVSSNSHLLRGHLQVWMWRAGVSGLGSSCSGATKERKINASACSSQPKYRLHKYLCRDTMRWGVEVRVISIGLSRLSCLLQPPPSDLLGLRRELNPHLWLGFAFGSPAGGTCPNDLLRQTSERYANRKPGPPQRAPLNVGKLWRNLKSALVVLGERGNVE